MNNEMIKQPISDPNSNGEMPARENDIAQQQQQQQQDLSSRPKKNPHPHQRAAEESPCPSLEDLNQEQSLEDRLKALECRLSREKELENRVEELETKLSVLSKLLKLQNKNNNNKNGNSIMMMEKKPLLQQQQQQECETSSSSASSPLRAKQTYMNRRERMEEIDSNSVPPPPPLDAPASPPPDLIIQKVATKTSSSQTPQSRRDDPVPTNNNIPHLDSPASFLGKDSESARLSWRKETDAEASSGAAAAAAAEGAPPTLPILYGHNNNKDDDENIIYNKDNTSSLQTPLTPTTSNRTKNTRVLFDETTPTKTNTAPLESLSAHKRNLSFNILYGGNEKAYQRGKLTSSAPPAPTSMTLAERRWLGSLAESISGERRNQVPDDNVRDKWLNYLNSFQESTHDVDVQMEEFIKVPQQVEGIMMFGFFICIDSFLYCVTVLPIRFVWSCLLLVHRLLWKKQISPAFTFHRRHSYQIIQVFILYCIYEFVLAPISIGQLYHWIRGQAMIKLYVLIAIVEVFDRLMCAMGQDCLDSMYWNTVNRPTSARMLISVVVVLVYCTIHTLFLFLHVATLNVAMNSADQALLTLLISGNFAEIKSTVFKKYNRPALFKLTAADISERFKLGLFLGLVLLLNYSQGMAPGQFAHFIQTCGYIWTAELVADWIKHSFITKFNFLPARVFVEYALLLAGDVTGIGHENVNVDHSHAVVKRIGFAQLPFVCVTYRLVREAAKYASLNEFWQSLSTRAVYGIFSASWFLLLVIKLALGSFLHRISLAKLRSAPDMSLTPKKKNS